MGGGAERRLTRRVPFREDVLIDGSKVSTSMDISEGGLFISAIQHYEPGTIIDVAIPFNGMQIMLRAVVRFCQTGIGMGIQFYELSDGQRTQVRALVKSLGG